MPRQYVVGFNAVSAIKSTLGASDAPCEEERGGEVVQDTRGRGHAVARKKGASRCRSEAPTHGASGQAAPCGSVSAHSAHHGDNTGAQTRRQRLPVEHWAVVAGNGDGATLKALIDHRVFQAQILRVLQLRIDPAA